MRHFPALVLLSLAGSVAAQGTQLPIPAFSSTFSSPTLTRGFCFQSPVAITIIGLRVPDESAQGVQCVELTLHPAMPPAYPATTSVTQSFFASNVPSNQIIPCVVPVQANEWVGVLGACGNATMANSYAAAGTFQSDVLGIPVTLTRMLTQTNLSTTGGNQPLSTEAGGSIGRVEVYYTTAGGNIAQVGAFGAGCLDQTSTFYETFAPGTFDLSGTAPGSNSLLLNPTGAGGYAVLPGSGTWFTPTSANLGLSDDSVSPSLALPFPLITPAGITSALVVSSNGFIWTGANGANGCCNGDPVALLAQGERFCPLWQDLNPGVGGTVHFDVDPSNTAAYVTWLGVPEFGQTNTNTFQVAFFASGAVEFRYQSCVNVTHTVLTGWSAGAGNRNPGSRDLSTSVPFVTQQDARPLVLATSARPRIGTSINWITTNVPTTSVLGILGLGFGSIVPGFDLAPLGAPGCYQHVGVSASAVFLPSGNTGTIPFAIPNNPGLAGVRVFAQSLALTPSVNPLGVVTSNGLDLLLNPN